MIIKNITEVEIPITDEFKVSLKFKGGLYTVDYLCRWVSDNCRICDAEDEFAYLIFSELAGVDEVCVIRDGIKIIFTKSFDEE